MSHFTRLKIRLKDKAALIAALEQMGYTVSDSPGAIRGFGGAKHRVDFKFRPSRSSYEIGFQATPDGYEIVADWWGVRGLKANEFTRQLTQRYATILARQRLEAQGFTLAGEEVDEKGCIHLRLRRMV